MLGAKKTMKMVQARDTREPMSTLRWPNLAVRYPFRSAPMMLPTAAMSFRPACHEAEIWYPDSSFRYSPYLFRKAG